MTKTRLKTAFQAVVILSLIMTACATGTELQSDDDTQSGNLRAEIRNEARPYSLDIVDWEIQNFTTPVDESPVGCMDSIAEKISIVLKEEGMPVIPAVQVRITRPPLLLVVSPRDKILYLDRILLLADLNDKQIEAIEKKVESLDVSALVVKIGGFGAAYPSIVSPDMDVKHQVSAAVEEWAHQSLAFRPLGFLYLLDSLGFSQAPEVISMNETLAGIIADEIGDKVYARYCQLDHTRNAAVKAVDEFDFDKEMKETREAVDLMLKNNKVEQAEQYMESRRQLFIQHGYRIRKINQAYFAFHGIYGQDPCSVSPVYNTMIQLRNSYGNLAGFVKDISNMKSYDELQEALINLSGNKDN